MLQQGGDAVPGEEELPVRRTLCGMKAMPRVLYQALAHSSGTKPERERAGPRPRAPGGPRAPAGGISALPHAAACQPLLELKTISIVQFDCLNQTDLQQIHLSFDKSITVSFH